MEVVILFISIDPVILISIIASASVLVILIGLLIYFKKFKKSKTVINDEYINELILAFGGISNIKEVSTENGGRVAIKVLDLDLLQMDQIKSLATSGVFITGNVVKTLFREDSQFVKEAIEKRI